MKFISRFLIFLVLAGCGVQEAPPEDAVDCGRQFIHAIFHGNFKRARQLTLPDPKNLSLLEDKLADDFRSRPPEDRDQLQNASIVINEIEQVSDSITIINFLNSYDQKPAVIKVVKQEGGWLIDLKYTFSGNF